MKTNQITRGAMVCAIYGAILFLNQQAALMIEASASWIFVFPVLIYTAMNGAKLGLITCTAMGLITFLFGGFTTWFYSWTSLVTGYVYGLGIFYHFKNMTNFGLCFIFSLISNVCTVLVWSALFGIDPISEFMSIKTWLPFINLQVFIILFVLFLALLQALCIHLIAIMVCMRMHIPFTPLQPISQQKSSKMVGILSLFIWGIFFLCQNVVECSKGAQDIIQIIWFIDCAFLLYYGIIYFMHYCVIHNWRKLSFFVIFFAFIPVINFIWMFMGELDCLFGLRKNYLK